MDPLQQTLLDRWGLRIEPHMRDYLERKLSDGSAGDLAVIGGEARTGRPMRIAVNPAQLQAAAAQRTSTTS